MYLTPIVKVVSFAAFIIQTNKYVRHVKVIFYWIFVSLNWVWVNVNVEEFLWIPWVRQVFNFPVSLFSLFLLVKNLTAWGNTCTNTLNYSAKGRPEIHLSQHSAYISSVCIYNFEQLPACKEKNRYQCNVNNKVILLSFCLYVIWSNEYNFLLICQIN